MKQPDLFTAAERGRVGLTRAVDHADRDSHKWSEQALELVQREARVRPEPFTIEAIRLAIQPALPTPPDGRAWGAVTQAAIRRGVIAKTGDYAPAASSNGSPKPLYRRTE